MVTHRSLVSSYYERIEEDWSRLTDPEWADILRNEEMRSPEWIEQHIVPAQP